jgi:LuxR family maltose regulon positive regulatory protein
MTNPGLLETKFHIPPWRAEGISRSRLLDRLRNGLSERCKLTFISAPAGYGKTALISEWLHSLTGNRNVAWISLDEGDNDPARFLMYFLTAFQRSDPSLGQSTQSLLGMPQIPQLTGILDELINELSGLDQSIVLGLDDYHVITNPDLHEALEYFLEHQPAQVHLAITTREDPPFPLARMRARGQMTEIRAHDLRFTLEEALQFFSQTMQIKLEADTVRTLHTRIEGWAAGMQLAALALQDQGNLQEFLSDFNGSHRYIIDYLLDEVLKHLRPEIRDFLGKTALLKRFNAALCQAVGAHPDAKNILAQLERANLFLIPLDDQRGWYRYHHLFADVLRANLSVEEEREACRRAATWFEGQELFAEALPYWLAVPDLRKAEQLIARLAIELLKNGELRTLLRWLDALPEPVVNKNPDLLSYKALSLLLTGQIERAQNCAVLTRQTLERESGAKNLGRLLAIQAWFTMISGSRNGGELAQEALGQLERCDDFFRAIAMLALGDYYAWNANLQSAVQVFREGVQLGKRLQNSFMALGMLANLAYNLLELGQLREAEALCRAALEEYVDQRGKPLPVLGIIYSPLATLCYERGAFDEAREFAQRSIDLSQRLFSNLILGGDSEVILARIAFQQGDPEAAFELLRSTSLAARQRQVLVVALKMEVAQAELLLLQGNPSAETILLELEEHADLRREKIKEIVAQLYARYWIVRDQPEKALPILTNLEQSAQKTGCRRRLIGISIAQALAFQKQGDLPQAKAAFEAALRLAAPEGCKAVFFSHAGWPTRSLLQITRAAAPDFVDSILSAHPAAEPVLTLPDPLSEQELRVLNLIIAGKSNQEIANALVISAGTAKWHVHNVLQKLGVNNRPQAIARARELGV